MHIAVAKKDINENVYKTTAATFKDVEVILEVATISPILNRAAVVAK